MIGWFVYGLALFFVVGWLLATHWSTIEKVPVVVYLGVVFIAFIGEFSGKRLFEKEERVYKRLQRNALYAGWGIMLAAPVIDHLYFPGSNSLLIGAGAIVALGGVWLRFLSLDTLGAYFSGNISVEETYEVITKGPYRIIRYPGYLGLILQAAGYTLILCSWYAGLFAVLFIALLIKRLLDEEWFMTRTLSDYSIYRRVTWRLIPGVW